jgi:uncharacterized membrane-anchored protein
MKGDIMRLKKLFIASLVTAFLCSSVTPAFASQNTNNSGNAAVTQGDEDQTGQELLYNTFTGKVTEISTYEDLKRVSVENEKGDPAVIVISKDTWIINNNAIAIGASITCFYDANAPMIMIYPPQYSATVVIVDQEEGVSYQPFTGTVKEIKNSNTIKGQKKISVEDEKGTQADIIVTDETYVTGDTVKVGSEITAYYNANAPMIKIYPPQYDTKVMIVNNDKADNDDDKDNGNNKSYEELNKKIDELIKYIQELLKTLQELR